MANDTHRPDERRIRRVLVANRGAIAVRIVRTLRRLGIESVLAASTVDRHSMAARLADRTLCIGPAPAAESYLRTDTLIEAALACGAQAIHPGYGFLAEHAPFAEACEKFGLTFIGPTAGQIACVSDPLEARRCAEAALVPVSAGRTKASIDSFVVHGRRIEVQVLGDGSDVVQLGERDCTIRRRDRKLIEEAPAPGLPDTLRGELHDAALRLARHIGYRSLGTVKFFVDVARERFHFVEMSARIQTEHPVTEQISGLDLVAEQIAVAQGEPLRDGLLQLRLRGHAIACRISAEDPLRDYRPVSGTVTSAHFPAGHRVRVETHIEAGATIPLEYDSTVAQLIVSGDDRDDARRGVAAALEDVRIDGVPTNVSLHRRLIATAAFAAGGVDTDFVDRQLALLQGEHRSP